MRTIPKQVYCLVLALPLMAAPNACHRSNAADESEGGAASQTDTGIPECDDYLSSYERCVQDKVPDDRKKVMEDALARTRTTWQTIAANPGARPALPQACSLARQTAQTTLKQYGCAW